MIKTFFTCPLVLLLLMTHPMLSSCADDTITCINSAKNSMYGQGHYKQGAKWTGRWDGGCCTIKADYLKKCNQLVSKCEGACDRIYKFYACEVD